MTSQMEVIYSIIHHWLKQEKWRKWTNGWHMSSAIVPYKKLNEMEIVTLLFQRNNQDPFLKRLVIIFEEKFNF